MIKWAERLSGWFGHLFREELPSSHVHMLVFARVLKYPILWPGLDVCFSYYQESELCDDTL